VTRISNPYHVTRISNPCYANHGLLIRVTLNMMEIKKKYHTPEVALQKLQAYCAYQERCHQEVMTKLQDLGMYGDRADDIVAQLITDNFLNEERFAVAYARGKFRIKQWGKIRIRQALKQRHIPDYSIKKAMAAIDTEGGYLETLAKVITTKAKDYEGDKQKKQKLANYALQRGFESEFIWEFLKDFS
jgi:regulatory protein